MMDNVEKGKIGIILLKDSSRFADGGEPVAESESGHFTTSHGEVSVFLPPLVQKVNLILQTKQFGFIGAVLIIYKLHNGIIQHYKCRAK
jgi:hypothetical protein